MLSSSVLLPIVLEDDEEIMIAHCFNLALDFRGGGLGIFEALDYAVIKDFCLRHELGSIEVLGMCKEMIAVRASV